LRRFVASGVNATGAIVGDVMIAAPVVTIPTAITRLPAVDAALALAPVRILVAVVPIPIVPLVAVKPDVMNAKTARLGARFLRAIN
jgi:hypothetical protein